MWRWSCYTYCQYSKRKVFSTYVEVILVGWRSSFRSLSFLHVCGGDPSWTDTLAVVLKFSPRMWRWSRDWWCQRSNLWVFSTYVEVILFISPFSSCSISFLHVCGGDPKYYLPDEFVLLFSPRMWRWSYSASLPITPFKVFSTYVEVILIALTNQRFFLCFLHVCGGDPYCHLPYNRPSRFSPRMWRWSSASQCLCTFF